MVSRLHISGMVHHSLRYLHWWSSRFRPRSVPVRIRDGVMRDTHSGANPHPRRKHETFLPRMGNLTPMRSWKRGHALGSGHNVLKTRAVRAISLTTVENKSKRNQKFFCIIRGFEGCAKYMGIFWKIISPLEVYYQKNVRFFKVFRRTYFRC